MSMAASLQQQLLEQQEQLALLQLQQQMHASSNQSAEQQQHQQQLVETRQSSQVAALELEVGKLKRRNTQLQTALAEASLQHARAAAAGQRQLAELLQEAAQLGVANLPCLWLRGCSPVGFVKVQTPFVQEHGSNSKGH